MVCDQIHYPNNYLDSFPYTEHLNHYTNHQELILAAQAAWEELRTTSISQVLVDSIQNRIDAIKASKGYPTKY